MKKLTGLLIIILFPIWGIAQNYSLTWQRCFGGSKQDIAFDIVRTGDKFLIAGFTESNNGDILYNHGITDAWVVMIDSVGDLLWEKTYGGSNGEWFVKIVPSVGNTYFLVGCSGSSDGDVSFDPYPASGDFWIVKIDADGNVLWDKIIGGNMYELLWSASPTSDGGVLINCSTDSDDGDVSVFYGGSDSWYSKISSDGEIEWDYTIGTYWADQGQAAIQTSDGGYLLVSTSIILEGGEGNITCIPHSYGWDEAVVFKLDSNLNLQWQRCYGGSNHDGFYGILEVDDGYVFVGSTYSDDGDVSGWHSGEDNYGYPTSDIWVVKTGYDGNIIWQNCYGGSGGESAETIIQNDDGGFTLFGVTNSMDNGDVSGFHGITPASMDIWMIKISNEGELLTQKCIGGRGSEYVDFGVAKKTDYDFVVAGQTDYGPSFDVQCTPHEGEGYLIEDYWVFELKDCNHYVLGVPSTPVGADTTCSFAGSQTVYTIPPAENATSYEWLLQPAAAGIITGDSLLGTVMWNENFEGTATVVVRSVSGCGVSQWSEPKYTQVNSCLGIEENGVLNTVLQVYPNPAHESTGFSYRLPSGNSKAVIKITDITGKIVAKFSVSGKEGRKIWDTRKISPGIYFYGLSIGGYEKSGKLVISK